MVCIVYKMCHVGLWQLGMGLAMGKLWWIKVLFV